MQTVIAPRGDARAFLTHFVVGSLDDDRYTVQRFRRRTAERRAAGKPRRDPEKARAFERRRYRRKLAERLAQGLCIRCGQAPAAPERAVCKNRGEKCREAERTRYAAGKAAGKPYGRARDLRRPPIRRPLCQLWAAGLRGRIVLRPSRRAPCQSAAHFLRF